MQQPRLAPILPAALLAALSAPIPASAQSVVDPELIVEPVIISGGPLSAPTSMIFLGPGDLLVAQKSDGRVRRVTNGVLQPGAVLDLAVNSASERGLLSLAPDPQFASNRLVYLFYTRSSTGGDTTNAGSVLDHRISRFTWTGSALINEQPLLTLPATPGPNHNGGILVFGPPNVPPAQQKLFAVLGDLNRNNQTENFSPAEGGAPPDDTGCIIRINPDGTTPSGADRGPFFDVAGGNPSLQRLYGYGIRNSFGLAFDPHPTLGGALWDTENGTADYDEINRVDPAYNGGWENQQGPTGFPDVNELAAGKVQFGGIGTYSEPEFSWRQIVAPTAIHFLSGAGLGPSYQYDCFVAAFRGDRLYRFELNASRTGFILPGGLADTVLDTTRGDTEAPILFGTGFGAPTDLKTGPDGNLYVLSFAQGQIHRIRRRAPHTRSNPVQSVRIVSFGTGYQELFFNYSTQDVRITPYSDATQSHAYDLPEQIWTGIFHYDYAAGRFTQAVYQLKSAL